MALVHQHDLIIREKGDDGVLECRGCREEIPGQKSYWCTLCEYYFHESCAKLPLEIKVFFHPCPLSLWISYFICNSCFRGYRGVLSYQCRRCDFDMCVDCTDQALSLATCSGESMTEQIRHCCHRHPLQPLPVKPNCSSSCPVCKMSCSFGPTWGCEPCNFRIHKPCLDFLPEVVQINLKHPQVDTWILKISPNRKCFDCSQTNLPNLVFYRAGHERNEYLCIFCCLVRRLIEKSSSLVSKVINHFFHPCPNLELKLCLPSSTCNACFLSGHNFSYHCKSCDFFLCFDCAQLPQLASHENEANQLIQHFCHWHPLKLFTGTVDTNHICNLCERFCSEPFYSCNDQCQFYVHKSCLDSIPSKTIHLLFNKTLVLLTVPSFECTTCNRQCLGLTFYCSERKCTFCIRCVLWPENVLGDDGRFKSILHWHQLSLSETRIEDKRRRCFLCKELCLPWTLCYKCSECALFFHKSCAELPAQLEHPMHPHHLLTLTNRSPSLLNEDMTCNLCLKSLSQDFPFYDVVYRCQLCGFQLDTQCATYLPSLEYKGHPHPLYAVVNVNGNTDCRACGKSCKGYYTIRCGDQECDFTLHLQCGPLPRTVKHACHVHPLTLKDYYVEDNGSDEFACHVCEDYRDPRLRVYCCTESCLMICDVKCVLHEVLTLLRGEREEVELVTPFPQVACKVINMKPDLVEVMLDTAIEGAGNEEQNMKHGFSLDELFDSFSDFDSEEEETFGIEILEEGNKSDDKLRSGSGKEDDESREGEESIETGTNLDEEESIETDTHLDEEESIETDTHLDEEESIETDTHLDEEESIETDTHLDEEVERYSFSWKALSRFKMSLRTPSEDDLKEEFTREYDGSTMTGAYALPEILCPIYEEFFERYNIIDHRCKLNYFQRRGLVFITCGIIHQMRIIKVVDVTKETILQWLGFIRFVEKKGKFNVGIVAQNIKQIWEAHYYIQSKKIVDDKTSRLERELEQVSMYQAEQRTKIDELKIKVYEAEAIRQELLLMDKEHTAYCIVGSRGPMKKVRSNALEIKWRSCYDSLVMYPGNLPTK